MNSFQFFTDSTNKLIITKRTRLILQWFHFSDLSINLCERTLSFTMEVSSAKKKSSSTSGQEGQTSRGQNIQVMMVGLINISRLEISAMINQGTL